MSFKQCIQDKELLQSLQDGHADALNALMEIYKRPLAKRVLHILRSKEDTEEVLQELFVRVWLNREKIDPEQSIKSYLFRIAENLVFDMIRKANREKRFVSAYQMVRPESYRHVEEQLYQEENRSLLFHIIDQIPESSRRVFILCKLEERSYDEVSKLLSISIATVNSHMTKANRFLKNYIRNHTDIFTAMAIYYVLSVI